MFIFRRVDELHRKRRVPAADAFKYSQNPFDVAGCHDQISFAQEGRVACLLLAVCYAVRAVVAGFAVKMPLKLSRYGIKTTTHSTQATSAGAIVAGESVIWNASML